MPITLTSNEKRNGCIFLALSLFLLPSILLTVLNLLPVPISGVYLNLLYYSVNFLAVVWIFRRFLRMNLIVALDRVFPVLWYAVLGYLGNKTLSELFLILTSGLFPGFSNVNDLSVALMVQKSPLMAAAVITLVPITEETLYRGLVFRGLYDRNPVLAYVISIAVFSAIHLMGYVGVYSPLHLLIAFLQYLPAGYCLCFAYRHSGTILCPILIHMAINAMSVYALVR